MINEELLQELKLKTLVFDIETSSCYSDGRPINITTDFDMYIQHAKVKFFGAYSYKHNKYYNLLVKDNEDFIIELLEEHDILVSFNGINFDFPILEINNLIPIIETDKVNFRTGLPYEKSKHFIHCDMMVILGNSTFIGKDGQTFKNRATLMGKKLKNNSLRHMAEVFELETKKGSIDYNTFFKDSWSEQELKDIYEYLEDDVKATKQLFEITWDFWKPFTEFIDENNIRNLSFIRSSVASLTYKSACYEMGVEETYGESVEKDEGLDAGGRVLLPKYEEAINMYYCDVGCIEENEWVYTNKGYKRAKDVRVYKKFKNTNDSSLSQDNSKNIFVDKVEKNKRKLIEIELSDGSIIKQTPEHKILTNNGVKRADEINKKDTLISPIHTPIKEGEYDSLFELLGIFVCEGSLFRKKRWCVDDTHPSGRNSTCSQTHLCVKNHEVHFQRQIKGLLEKYVPYKLEFKVNKKISGNKKYTHLDIRDTRREVYDWFYNFKEKYYNHKEILRDTGRVKAFLTGIFKSDFCWNIVRHSIQFRTTEKKRMELVHRCLQCLGIHGNYYRDKVKRKRTDDGGYDNFKYVLEISYGSEIQKIFSWFKWESYRDEKITKIKDTEYNKKSVYLHIMDIKEINGNFKVYDFTMQRQESPYYVHNGIFTHNSLYPHNYIMFNLAGEVEEGTADAWHGNEMFKINGYYDLKNYHPLSNSLKNKIAERIHLKNTDPNNPKIYALKIFANSYYGASRSPIFEKIYTKNGANDCCLIGQTIHEFMEKSLEQLGFDVIMGDTDGIGAVPLDELYNDDEYVIECLNIITDVIKQYVPFPVDTFGIGIDFKATYIMFPFHEQAIQGEDGKNIKVGNRLVKERKAIKKNYVYIYEKDGEKKVKIMGLQVKKEGATELSKKIYNNILKPLILKRNRAKFTHKEMDYILENVLKKDGAIELLGREFKVKPFHTYKNPNQLQASISKFYFGGQDGQIFLIKNKKVGCGKGSKYATYDMIRDAGLTIKDMDLTKLNNELEPFILYEGDE